MNHLLTLTEVMMAELITRDGVWVERQGRGARREYYVDKRWITLYLAPPRFIVDFPKNGTVTQWACGTGERRDILMACAGRQGLRGFYANPGCWTYVTFPYPMTEDVIAQLARDVRAMETAYAV